MAKLTPQQQAFCDYYIETANATEAYLKAGYKVKSNNAARANASRLLTNDNVLQYIDERLKQKEAARIASQDEILQFLTSVMRGEVTEQVPVIMHESFQLINKEPSVHDRIKAAEHLGKRYGLWKDNVNVSGDVLVKFVDDIDG